MFSRLDVSAGRQPKLRILVIHKKHPLVVYDCKVRHKVLGRNGRFGNAAEVGAGCNPRDRIRTVLCLDCIERHDELNLGMNLLVHEVQRWS